MKVYWIKWGSLVPPRKGVKRKRKRRPTKRKKQKQVVIEDLEPSNILSVIYVNDSGVYHFYFENQLIKDTFTDYVLTSGFIAAVMTFSKESLSDTPSLIKMSQRGMWLHLCTARENTLCLLSRKEIPKKYLSILDFIVRKFDVPRMASDQQLQMMTELRDVIHEFDPSFTIGEQEITKWVTVSRKDGFKVSEEEIKIPEKEIGEAESLLDELDNI